MLQWEDNFIYCKKICQSSLNIFVLTETTMLIMCCQNNDFLLFVKMKVF